MNLKEVPEDRPNVSDYILFPYSIHKTINYFL